MIMATPHSSLPFFHAVPPGCALDSVALRLGKVTFRWSMSVRPVGVICRKVTNVSFFLLFDFGSLCFLIVVCKPNYGPPLIIISQCQMSSARW